MRTVRTLDVEAAIEEVCDEAQSAGDLPLAVFPGETKDDVFREFARRLSFPSYFGRNLDAFADAMNDFVYALVGPTTLAVGISPEFEADSALPVIEDILHQAEQSAPTHHPLRVVMIRPSGHSK